jgi:hypothetical protein
MMEAIRSSETSVSTRATQHHIPEDGILHGGLHIISFINANIFQFVRFEVFTAVAMKNDVFWDVTPCGSCKNRRFGGTWHLLHQGDKNR